MPPTQAEREIEIITPLGTDVLLLSAMTVTEELGRLFTINVELASEQNIVIADILGQNVSIRLNLMEGTRFFNGYVSSISQSVNEGRYYRYHATIHPWLWLLTRTADCRIFQQMTVPDIINQVCNDLGFSDIENKLSAEYRTWEYCVQYRETDFNFLSRLMEQEGIYYYFTHEEGKHTLNLADSSSSHVPLEGEATIEYHPPSNDRVILDDEYITSWFVSHRIQPGSCVLTDYDFKLPKVDLKVDANIAKQHSEAEYEVFDYPGEYVSSDDGSNYVRTRIEELHTQQEQAQGEGTVKAMGCGALFTLANFNRDDQNREYLLVSVAHNIEVDDYEAMSGSGTSYSNSFNVVASDVAFRSARITPKPIVQGPQTAVVVGPDGEEIYTDEHGQVKLQFHWDRYGESNENSSCWVRVSQLWAGKTWGGIHIPRIGQEVIVEFLEGDPDRPIVTGRVYNGDQTPPYELPANKTQSGIKSRSSQGGSGANFNEIRFEDKMGEEQVYVHAEKNQDNIVENDETTFVGNDRTEEVGNDETLLVKNDRTTTVNNNHIENVLVDQTIDIGGNQKEDITGNRTVKVIGNNTGTIVGNNKETVQGSSAVKVLGNSDVWVIANKFTKTVGNTGALYIGATTSTHVGFKHGTTIGASVTLDMSTSISATKGAKATLAEATSIHKSKLEKFIAENLHSIEAPCVLIEGTDSVTVFVDGSTRVKLTAGKVEIKAGNIEIEGDVKIKGNLHVTKNMEADKEVKGQNIHSK